MNKKEIFIRFKDNKCSFSTFFLQMRSHNFEKVEKVYSTSPNTIFLSVQKSNYTYFMMTFTIAISTMFSESLEYRSMEDVLKLYKRDKNETIIFPVCKS